MSLVLAIRSHHSQSVKQQTVLAVIVEPNPSLFNKIEITFSKKLFMN